MTPLLGALTYVVGPGLTTMGALAIAQLRNRATVQTAAVSTKPEQDDSAISGYHQLVNDLREDVGRLRDDYKELRVDHDNLKTHVVRLENQARKDESLIQNLLAYIVRLRDLIVSLGGVAPPAPVILEYGDPVYHPGTPAREAVPANYPDLPNDPENGKQDPRLDILFTETPAPKPL